VSLMPNPGSLVQMQSGFFGIVTDVTPKGDGDNILVFGSTGNFDVHGVVCVDLIHRIIHEPELPVTAERGA
jgi:hypothetical protein